MSERTQPPTVSTELERPARQGSVVTGAERALAVEQWLLCAAKDRDQARAEWEQDGGALLRCGGLFSAIRLPLALVAAAAGTDDRQHVAAYLADALHGGGVFVDEVFQQVYFLVPTAACQPGQTGWLRGMPDAGTLHSEAFLGVPRPCTSDRRRYWLVEMGGPGDLCTPDAVKQLVAYARFRDLQNDA
ncbi:hypothetical protein ABZ473_26495 [Streptomyces cellulosae]